MTSDNYKLEMRQTAGMALAFNVMALAYSPPFVAFFVNPGQDWNGNATTFPPWLMVVSLLFEVIFTLINIPIAVCVLVQDRYPSPAVAKIALVLTLLVWFPFLTVIAFWIFNCNKYPETQVSGLIGPQYEATHQEIRVLTFLYIITFYAYGGSTIGALTFFQWKIWNFVRPNVSGISRYGRSYYDSRQLYYGDLATLGGLSQLILGSFIVARYQSGKLPSPITVNVFTVMFPEMSIVMGILVFLFGLLVIHRAHHRRRHTASDKPHFLSDDTFYVLSCALFLLSIGIQILGQVSPAPPEYSSRANESINALAIVLMPVYLDMKGRITPVDLGDTFKESETEALEEVRKEETSYDAAEEKQV